jgi:hypothetical protein
MEAVCSLLFALSMGAAIASPPLVVAVIWLRMMDARDRKRNRSELQ